ncbi:MAG TPA: EF-hand domain-containing protein [Pirellulales bacterium]|jgi:hypothetical protein
MRLLIIAALAVLLLDTSSAFARYPRHRGNSAARAAAAQRQAAFLQQFDADGNGQLDPTEKQAAQAAIKQMKGKGTGQAGNLGGNTGGKLASDKKKLAEKLTPEQKKELVKRFDKDGDGKLSAEEREAAKQALKKDGELK